MGNKKKMNKTKNRNRNTCEERKMFCKSIYFSCSLIFFIQKKKLPEKCQFIVLAKFMLFEKKKNYKTEKN